MGTEIQEYEFHSESAGPDLAGPALRWVKVDSGGSKLRLHIRAWEGKKQPFVLLHGLASNARTWDGVAQVLARHGHPVVAIDQRGHGLSDKPATGYDFVSVSDDLAAVLEALHLDQPVVAGQSWGGNVLLDFGARYTGRAAGLVFVDGGYIDLQSRSDGEWEKVAEQLRPPDWLGVQRAFLAERIRLMHPDWSEAGIEATLGNFEMLPDGSVRPWLSLDRHMAILRALWEQRPQELYSLVNTPVLIAVAEDHSNPTWMAAKRMQVEAAFAGLANAQIEWFDNTAHDIHVHRPVALAELMLEWSKSLCA